MARPIVLGNGNILVGMDDRAQVRDFFFPYVGSENHVGRRDIHNIGVWVNGNFSWFSDQEWQISLSYRGQTMAAEVSAYNERLKVTLHFIDVVYNEKNIFLRSLTVTNHDHYTRSIRVFFNQQFEISQTYNADTAYYNPTLNALIHYKGRRVLLAGGIKERGGKMDEFTTGLFNIEGKEGTWRDAEDGHLGGNPIEHGSVDSTMGFYFDIPPEEKQQAYYWICVGETFSEVEELQYTILHRKPEHIRETTEDYWRAWVNKFDYSFHDLDQRVVEEFYRSLLIIRTHCDNNGGILASGDTAKFQYGRDTYSYVWPRDGMFIALAMDKTGYFDVARRFYQFCNEVMTEGGYMLHKYQPDRSLGSSWHPWYRADQPQLAIQEDETAAMIYGLWEHYKYSKELEFTEKVYNSFIKKAADFLRRYRDSDTGLPAPSYGLWEERYGISTFTASSVYGGLIAAGRFAELLGKDKEKELYFAEAGKTRDAILKHLYNPENGGFYKLITYHGNEPQKDPTVDASSFYGLYRFGVLPPEDERMERAFVLTEERLSNVIPIGGVARYENDKYHFPEQEAEGIPGNPWFVTTLWLTEYIIARAESVDELKRVNKDLLWVVDHALNTGVLSEQLHPVTGEPRSVAPLIWSHAELVLTVIDYLKKLEQLGVKQSNLPVRE